MSEKQPNKSRNSMDEPKDYSSRNLPDESQKNKNKDRQSTEEESSVATVESKTPSFSNSAREHWTQRQEMADFENALASNSEHSKKTLDGPKPKSKYIGNKKTLKAQIKRDIRELHCGKLGQRELSALTRLNILFCFGNHWIIETFVSDKSAVERCVQFMRIELSKKDENEKKKQEKERKELEGELRLESAQLLCKVTAGNEQQIKVVVNTGAVEELISYLKMKRDWEFAEVAVATLGNILLGAPSVRNFVFSKGIVSPLVDLVAPETPPILLETLAKIIEDFCRPNQPSPPERKHIIVLLPAVTKLLQTSDETVLAGACKALFRLYGALNTISEKTAKEIIKLGLVERLKELLNGGNDKVVILSVQVVPLIVESSELIAKQVFRVGIFPSLTKILTESKNDLVVEMASATVRNISGQGASLVSHVVAAGLVPVLVDVQKTGNFGAQANASCALMYTALQNEHVFRHLCEPNSISIMCTHLYNKDLKVVSAALTAIGKTLNLCATKPDQFKNLTGAIKNCGGLDLIKKWQKNNNKNIRKLALGITRKYSLE